MKKILLVAGIAALTAACGQKDAAPAANDANVAEANAVATPAAFQLNGTTWTFTDKDGQSVQETIDDSGNYSATSGAKEIDRGTAVIKDGKACFTSSMDKSGETCWTTQPVAIGQSMETTSDKGEKLTVMRVDYVSTAAAQ